MNDMERRIREQFRLDTNCPEEMERERIIMINPSRKLEGGRTFADISTFFRAIIYRGELYLMCDEKIMDWAEENFSQTAPEWFCKFENLRKIDQKLQEYGYKIMDTHVYFDPDPEYVGYDFDCPYELEWLDRDQILEIKGNPFKNALMYQEGCPDHMAVAALNREGERIAMAGVSTDGKHLWQIGIDVLKEYRGKGLAVYLTTLLKEKVLEIGKIPFYGTSESHAISRTVGIRAGFRPAWCEVYSKCDT